MNLDELPTRLGSSRPFDQRPDGCWLIEPRLNVTGMAQVMQAEQSRLVTITAYPASHGEHRLIYHWDWRGVLLNIVTETQEGSIGTITPIYPAADWVEREIRDYFAVHFIGRETTPPLMLREGMPPGVMTWQNKNGGQA